MARNKLRPPKWQDKEEYEEAYAECMRLLNRIFWLSLTLSILANVADDLVSHVLHWTFFGIGLGSLLLSVVVAFLGMMIKHDRPQVLSWYDKHQGTDAVTIADSE